MQNQNKLREPSSLYRLAKRLFFGLLVVSTAGLVTISVHRSVISNSPVGDNASSTYRAILVFH
jgi:hypothetical protein